MKLTLWTTLILVSLLGGAACSPQKDVVRETVIVRESPDNSNNGDGETGPDHSGGGAGTEGKPFESYQVTVAHLPDFKTTIEPILKNLETSFPEFAADLRHIMSERVWYIIPGPLNKLPAVKMGVDFIPFDQLAIQNLNEVWIDFVPYYSKMAEVDRAKLILHELVIGARLLDYSDGLDLCLAKTQALLFDSTTATRYKKQRQDCHRVYKRYGSRLKPSRGFDLNNKDYAAIRAVVKNLIESQGRVDQEELRAWLANNYFERYQNN